MSYQINKKKIEDGFYKARKVANVAHEPYAGVLVIFHGAQKYSAVCAKAEDAQNVIKKKATLGDIVLWYNPQAVYAAIISAEGYGFEPLAEDTPNPIAGHIMEEKPKQQRKPLVTSL